MYYLSVIKPTSRYDSFTTCHEICDSATTEHVSLLAAISAIPLYSSQENPHTYTNPPFTPFYFQGSVITCQVFLCLLVHETSFSILICLLENTRTARQRLYFTSQTIHFSLKSSINNNLYKTLQQEALWFTQPRLDDVRSSV